MRVKSLQDLPEAMRRQAANALAGGSKIAAPVEPGETKRGNKFGAERKEVNGIVFPSCWQADRYMELLMLERAGLIHDLTVEVPFALEVRNPAGEVVRVGAYVADAVYWRDDRMAVEDAKSKITRIHPLYVWKRSHFEIQYGIRITEVERHKPRFGVCT